MIRKKDRTSVDPSLSGIWALVSAVLYVVPSVIRGNMHMALNKPSQRVLTMSPQCVFRGH